MHINFIFNEIVIKKPREKAKFEMVLAESSKLAGLRLWERRALLGIYSSWWITRESRGKEKERFFVCLKLVEI